MCYGVIQKKLPCLSGRLLLVVEWSLVLDLPLGPQRLLRLLRLLPNERLVRPRRGRQSSVMMWGGEERGHVRLSVAGAAVLILLHKFVLELQAPREFSCIDG